MSATHADYGIELAAYNAGQRVWPPCVECAREIPDAPYTGQEVCDDCEHEPGWWRATAVSPSPKENG